MATFPWGNRGVLTVDPVTGLPAAEPITRMISDRQLAKLSDLVNKASTQSVSDLTAAVNSYTAAINAANQNASSAQTAAGANLAAVPAQSKAALIGLGYLPKIAYVVGVGWPARADALAAMGLSSYTGPVQWSSPKTLTSITGNPPGALRAANGSWEDEWERKKA